MKIYEYRVIQGCDSNMNHRWEVQRKYVHYNGVALVESWQMICWSTDMARCIAALERYKADQPKKYQKPWKDYSEVW